jgi:hypothetical protein
MPLGQTGYVIGKKGVVKNDVVGIGAVDVVHWGNK